MALQQLSWSSRGSCLKAYVTQNNGVILHVSVLRLNHCDVTHQYITSLSTIVPTAVTFVTNVTTVTVVTTVPTGTVVTVVTTVTLVTIVPTVTVVTLSQWSLLSPLSQ